MPTLYVERPSHIQSTGTEVYIGGFTPSDSDSSSHELSNQENRNTSNNQNNNEQNTQHANDHQSMREMFEQAEMRQEQLEAGVDRENHRNREPKNKFFYYIFDKDGLTLVFFKFKYHPAFFSSFILFCVVLLLFSYSVSVRYSVEQYIATKYNQIPYSTFPSFNSNSNHEYIISMSLYTCELGIWVSLASLLPYTGGMVIKCLYGFILYLFVFIMLYQHQNLRDVLENTIKLQAYYAVDRSSMSSSVAAYWNSIDSIFYDMIEENYSKWYTLEVKNSCCGYLGYAKDTQFCTKIYTDCVSVVAKSQQQFYSWLYDTFYFYPFFVISFAILSFTIMCCGC
ncbi:hypothetical protein WA158_001988 [Blastocystis sp. Blastoise]